MSAGAQTPPSAGTSRRSVLFGLGVALNAAAAVLFAIPVVGISAGALITKYVMGLFERNGCQLYVSRGIGVVGVPIRVFVPPEIALLELRRR